MRVNVNDYIGKVYNDLTIISYGGRRERDNKIMVNCLCVCGNEKAINLKEVKNGKIKSCGCRVRRVDAERNYKHGYSVKGNKERLYHVWINMKRRCYKHDDADYHNYGARGIAVCNEWKNDYVAFREWALSHGYDENAEYGKCTIDRIDTNGNYEPSNCRWVDVKTQANNVRSNVVLEYDGERHTLSEWSEIRNLNYATIETRYRKGYPVEDILFCGKFDNNKRRVV